MAKAAMGKYINVPNVLSASRILLFPVLLWLAWTGQDKVFAWLFFFSLFTDFADGIIARRFNMITQFGSRLDSWGDLCNYIAAFFGIILLHPTDVKDHATGFLVLFVLYIIAPVIMLIKFSRVQIGMHLYISKITGYVHGFFLLSWMFFGLSEMFYILAMAIGYYAFTEEIAVVLLLKKPDHDLKSFYWVLKHRKDLWNS
jgi:cardiolipin synthase